MEQVFLVSLATLGRREVAAAVRAFPCATSIRGRVRRSEVAAKQLLLRLPLRLTAFQIGEWSDIPVEEIRE